MWGTSFPVPSALVTCPWSPTVLSTTYGEPLFQWSAGWISKQIISDIHLFSPRWYSNVPKIHSFSIVFHIYLSSLSSAFHRKRSASGPASKGRGAGMKSTGCGSAFIADCDWISPNPSSKDDGWILKMFFFIGTNGAIPISLEVFVKKGASLKNSEYKSLDDEKLDSNLLDKLSQCIGKKMVQHIQGRSALKRGAGIKSAGCGTASGNTQPLAHHR